MREFYCTPSQLDQPCVDGEGGALDPDAERAHDRLVKSSQVQGVARVADATLARLLRMLHRGEVPEPIGKAWLFASGFESIAEFGEVLVGLDARAARAAIVCALAERKGADATRLHNA